MDGSVYINIFCELYCRTYNDFLISFIEWHATACGFHSLQGTCLQRDDEQTTERNEARLELCLLFL